MDLYLKRIWKYKFHYLLAFPPLLLIFLLKIIPFIAGVRMAFTDVKPFYGIFGSEWIGGANFDALFGMPEFMNILGNTVAIKLSYMGVVGIVSLVLAVALSGIQSDRLRNAFVLLFLVPYFIPSFWRWLRFGPIHPDRMRPGFGRYPRSIPHYGRLSLFCLSNCPRFCPPISTCCID